MFGGDSHQTEALPYGESGKRREISCGSWDRRLVRHVQATGDTCADSAWFHVD